MRLRYCILQMVLGSVLGCQPATINGSFMHGFDSWKLSPRERFSIYGQDKSLLVSGTGQGDLVILKRISIDANTDIVRISFRSKLINGIRSRNVHFGLKFNETGNDFGFTKTGDWISSTNEWKTHTLQYVFADGEKPHRSVFYCVIVPGEGEGDFLLDDFVVTEYSTKVERTQR